MVYFLSISKNSFGIMILSMIFLLRMKTNYFSNYSDDNEKQYIVFKIQVRRVFFSSEFENYILLNTCKHISIKGLICKLIVCFIESLTRSTCFTEVLTRTTCFNEVLARKTFCTEWFFFTRTICFTKALTHSTCFVEARLVHCALLTERTLTAKN